MSLINDMLKDLDARRPDRRKTQAESLAGLSASRYRESRGERFSRVWLHLTLALLVVLLGVTLLRGPARSPGLEAAGGMLEPSGLVMAEAIELLDRSMHLELPPVSQGSPVRNLEPGYLERVHLESRAGGARLSLWLSQETLHGIELNPKRNRVEVLLMRTQLLEALPELDFSGTPILAIHARPVRDDLVIWLDLSGPVRAQSTMLAEGDSAQLVLDLVSSSEESTRPTSATRHPAGTKVFEKKVRPPTAHELASQTYRHAISIAQLGDDVGAILTLYDALALDPGHSVAREALASLLMRTDRVPEAETLLDAGLLLDPTQVSFAKLKARALVVRGAQQEALTLLEGFEGSLADDLEVHALIAALYQRQGEHESALTHYRRVLQQQANKSVWWMGLGISLEGTARPGEALTAYRAAASLGSLGPDSQRYVSARITVLEDGSD